MRVSGETIRSNVLITQSKLSKKNILNCPMDDQEKIRTICATKRLYIEPFVAQKRVHLNSSLSYGLTYAGYDVRLDRIRFANKQASVDASKLVGKRDRLPATASTAFIYGSDERDIVDRVRELQKNMWLPSVSHGWLFPGDFCIGSIMEFMYVPSTMDGGLKDKSSLARLGLQVQNTVIEPGWMGYLTVELINHGHMPIFLEHGMPIGQMQYTLTDYKCEPYEGKYQNQQAEPTPAR